MPDSNDLNPKLIAVVHGVDPTDSNEAIVGFQSLNPNDCVTPEGDDQSFDRARSIAVDAGLSCRFGPNAFGMIVWVAPDGDPNLWLTGTSVLRVIARRIRLLRSVADECSLDAEADNLSGDRTARPGIDETMLNSTWPH